MKNQNINKDNFKELPKTVKFAHLNSENEDDFLLEFLIARLIHNGATMNILLRATDKIEDSNEKKEMENKIINTVVNFILLNPEYDEILMKNNGF